MRAVIAVQARLGSTRLPRKILSDINGKPMLSQIVRRCKATRLPVTVSCPPEDAVEIAKALPGVDVVSGPEKDILFRLLLVAAHSKASHVVRVTGDCPLIPHDLILAALEASKKGAPCVQNWRPRTFPDGFDFEIWDVGFLVALKAKLKPEDAEYFAQYCLDKKLPNYALTYAGKNMAHLRLTVDYAEDLDVIREIYQAQGEDIWESGRVVEWCNAHPATMALNAAKVDGRFGARSGKGFGGKSPDGKEYEERT
jgi:spore coat polysaccharide biosynthesis protein SpsF (cytidylyltransferase family)